MNKIAILPSTPIIENLLTLELRKRSKRHGDTESHLERRIFRQRPLQVGVLDISLQPVHRHNVIPLRRSPLSIVSIHPSSIQQGPTYLNKNNPHPNQHNQNPRKSPQPNSRNQPQHTPQTNLLHIILRQKPCASVRSRLALLGQQVVVGGNAPAGFCGGGFGAVVGGGVLALHWRCAGAERGEGVHCEGEAEADA